jgi:hypothetical protein
MVAGGFFLNPGGLFALLVLIPFLILYLIRPKPRHETVPSLLFVMRDGGKSNINSFFRNFLNDLVFLFQLFALLLLALAIAKPYIEVPRSYLVEQTVLLVDVSGSTHANNDARFDEVIAIAKENLGRENTIILIKGSPDVLAERVSASKAQEDLEHLKPTETATGLTDALKLAANYAATGTRIAVISDFLPTAGDEDYETASAALESTGALVEYLPVTGGVENVGIIDLLVGPVTSTVWLKNYDARPAQVTLKISDAEQQVLMARGETKQVTFKTPPGVAELTIKEDDGLLADNKAWTSSPEKNKIRMLVITNNQAAVAKSNFLLALNVISKNFPTSFDISYGIPPKIPTLDHDIYVVDDAKLEFILPGYVKDLKEKVSQGAGLIVMQQPDVFALDWLGLLPVKGIADSQGGRASIVPAETNQLTQDIDFGQASGYLRVQATDDAAVVAKTEQDSIIAMRREGRGLVLYYGIDDARTSFSNDPAYPVFWRRAFDLLTERPSLANLNVRTGSMLSLPKPATIKTPDGKMTAALFPIDRAGLYVLADRTVAANMLSPGESAATTPENVTKARLVATASGSEKAPKELTDYFLWAAVIILFLEILYVKWRGDF